MRVRAHVGLVGEVARIHAGGELVGVLYGWQLAGSDGLWTASADKHRFREEFTGREVEVRFRLTARDEPYVELRGTGQMFSPYIADGSVHRETVLVQGEALWLQTEQSPESS